MGYVGISSKNVCLVEQKHAENLLLYVHKGNTKYRDEILQENEILGIYDIFCVVSCFLTKFHVISWHFALSSEQCRGWCLPAKIRDVRKDQPPKVLLTRFYIDVCPAGC